MDHSIPSETTGVLAQERYGIASPAPRHGFTPPLTCVTMNGIGPVFHNSLRHREVHDGTSTCSDGIPIDKPARFSSPESMGTCPAPTRSSSKTPSSGCSGQAVPSSARWPGNCPSASERRDFKLAQPCHPAQRNGRTRRPARWFKSSIENRCSSIRPTSAASQHLS